MKYSKTTTDAFLAVAITLVVVGAAYILYQVWDWMGSWELSTYRLLLIIGLPLTNIATLFLTRQFFSAQLSQHHKGLETGVGVVGKAAAQAVDLRGQMHRQVREVWRPMDQPLSLPPLPAPKMITMDNDTGQEVEL